MWLLALDSQCDGTLPDILWWPICHRNTSFQIHNEQGPQSLWGPCSMTNRLTNIWCIKNSFKFYLAKQHTICMTYCTCVYHTLTHHKQSHKSASLPKNDWFLNRGVIDPYPGCKWKHPQHHFWQPAPVLLGRWEATCGKMKAICLDGAMSSVCYGWCKQLNLSRYDKPWTVITHTTPAETPSLKEPNSVTSDWFGFCHNIFQI